MSPTEKPLTPTGWNARNENNFVRNRLWRNTAGQPEKIMVASTTRK